MTGEARLTTLPPELLSSILGYLTLRDIYSVLLTCKSLYPVSYRQLWSVLHLCDRIPPKYRGPPCPPFVHDPENAVGNDGCRRLVRAIKERGAESLGFGSVRGLVLEPEMFSRSIVRDGLVRVIGDEIEAGRMRLGWVKVSIWSSYLETSDSPPEGIERFLMLLKGYTQTRSSDEFSFILDANFITSISPWYRPKSTLFDLIDLEKLTSLDLQLDVFHEDEDEEDDIEDEEDEDSPEEHNEQDSRHGSDLEKDELNSEDEDDDEDAKGEAVPKPPVQSAGAQIVSGTVAEQIMDLTRLLTATVNLTTLKLAADTEDRGYMPPPMYKLANMLSKLQKAFTALKKLKWLSLHGPMFHPSFFITPPENVRKLRIRCDLSVSWWRRFARCPFRSVEELTIGHHYMTRGSWMGHEDEDDYEGITWGNPLPFRIGDVQVTSLKRFWCEGMFSPEDLVKCILRKNRGLDDDTVIRLEGLMQLGAEDSKPESMKEVESEVSSVSSAGEDEDETEVVAEDGFLP